MTMFLMYIWEDEMTKQGFDVLAFIRRKAVEWHGSLTDTDEQLVRERLAAQEQIPPGAGAAVDSLAGYTESNRVTAKVLLEAMGRFAPFEEVLDDVRVRLRIEQPMFSAAVAEANVLYNTAIAIRAGARIEGDTLLFDDASLAARRDAWTAGLSDYQLEDINTDAITHPGHIVDKIAPVYSDPEFLPELVKQCVQDMRSFGEFMTELREWGDWGALGYLDGFRTPGFIQRTYNTLIAQGHSVDVKGELVARRERRSETVTVAQIAARFEGKYERPDLLEDEIQSALSRKKTFAELFQILRIHGNVSMTNAEFSDACRDYEALQVRHAKATETGKWRDRIGGPTTKKGKWVAAALDAERPEDDGRPEQAQPDEARPDEARPEQTGWAAALDAVKAAQGTKGSPAGPAARRQ